MTPEDIRIRHWHAVAELYRGVLQREPDPFIDTYVEMLEKGEIDYLHLIQTFFGSNERKALMRQAEEKAFIGGQSQFGEIEILLRDMVNGDQPRTVVDVGARGKARSNSWDLMNSFGWRGVLVEANPDLIPAIEAEFEGLDLTLLNFAVSDYDGEGEFYFGVNDDISALSAQQVEAWGAVRGSTPVTVRRVPTLLGSLGVAKDFDLLSIDVEGEDIKVLNDTIAGGYRPRWVIVEACEDFRVETLFDQPFSEAVRENYRIVGRTAPNLILRSEAVGGA